MRKIASLPDLNQQSYSQCTLVANEKQRVTQQMVERVSNK